MKNIIIILFCLLTVTTYAQQKKTNNTKAKTSMSVKKKSIPKKLVESKKCSVCYSGSGKCYMCGGRGWKFCTEHYRPYEELDEECDEMGLDDCYYAVYCKNCGNEENKYQCGICLGSGKCNECNGTGKK